MDLTDYRNKIDSIDDEICRLFTERMNVVNEIGEFKRSHDVPVSSSSREREVLARISKQLPEDLEDFGRVLYRSMFDISKAYEAMYKEKDSPLYKAISGLINADPAPFPKRAVVACQGREGAYSQIAAEKLFEVPEIMFNNTFEGVIRMVTDGLCEYGILPIENSTAGSVNEIYDLLVRYNVHIVRSTRVRVDHQLLAAKGTRFQDIKTIYSHPHPRIEVASLPRPISIDVYIGPFDTESQINCFSSFPIFSLKGFYITVKNEHLVDVICSVEILLSGNNVRNRYCKGMLRVLVGSTSPNCLLLAEIIISRILKTALIIKSNLLQTANLARKHNSIIFAVLRRQSHNLSPLLRTRLFLIARNNTKNQTNQSKC